MTAVGDGVEAFGALLRRHRRAAGLSQAELAERAGLSLRGIADLERGARRSPYPATVRRLLEALGLDEAERATLLAAARPDEPASGPAGVEPTRSLPLPLTSFVGREREIVAIQRLVETGRLVTLTGTGGIGKTRLALEVARARADAVFVDLAPLVDGGLVSAAVAAALGIREQPNVPVQKLLSTSIAARDLVLVLDNCEHLVHACAELVETLLKACPNLRVLATSREVLGVAGETVWRVPSLLVPAPDVEITPAALADYGAPRLFLDRARAAVPDLAITDREAVAIATVCRRLDGIPLAIELAAARVRVLGLAQLAERLDDQLRLLVGSIRGAPSRQQTLRATLDWSYALLPQTEQALLRRLAVFAGGWALEAAEAIATHEGIGAPEVLDALERLVDKSLVLVEDRHGRVRYRLLEPIRQYAQERLAASGEAPVTSQRHAGYFLELAKTAEPALWGSQLSTWQQRLEHEHDNLRATLRWLIGQGEVRCAQELGGALARFWLMGGYHREGQAWLTEVLGLPDAAEAAAIRAKALVGLGMLASFHGDYTAARSSLERGLALAREAGDREATAHALYRLADLAWWRGDHVTAQAMGEAALAASRMAGHRALEACSLFSLGAAAWGQGSFAEAHARLEESLALYQEVGFPRGVAMALGFLGRVSLAQGDLVSACARLEASREVFGSIDFPWGIAHMLAALGWVALQQGELAKGRALLGQSLHMYQELGERVWVLRPLDGLVALAVAEGQYERAVRLAGAVSSLRARAGALVLPVEQVQLEPWLKQARAELGEARAEEAEAAGRLLSLEEAIAEALAGPPQAGAEAARAAAASPRESADAVKRAAEEVAEHVE